MTVERTEPPLAAQERQMLEAWLDFHRDTLALKCDGLTGGQLRQRAVPPAKLSLLGLVRHMAEGEQQWFQMVLGDEQVRWHYYTEDNPDADFDDVDSADVAEAFETWRSECAQARKRVAAAPSLDVTATHRGREFSLRWIMIHMIEEYARHNGHADLLRERIDGTVGDLAEIEARAHANSSICAVPVPLNTISRLRQYDRAARPAPSSGRSPTVNE